MEQNERLKLFAKHCVFIPLNKKEGYYECQGIKGLDTREVYLRWKKLRGFK